MEAYDGHMDDVCTNGGCVVVVEAFFVAVSSEANVIGCGLRDLATKLTWVKGIMFERGQSFVNPLYEQQV